MSYPPPGSSQNNDPNVAPDAPAIPALPYAPPPSMPQSVNPSGAAAYDAPASPPAPQTDYAYRSPLAGVAAAALANENPHPARYLAGLALGLVVGLICAFLYDKFVFYTNIGLGIIASLIGFAVGFAVLIGCGRGGIGPAAMGGAISLFSMLASRFMLLNDIVSKQVGHTVVLPVNGFTIGLMFKTMEIMSWVIVAGGVYGGFMTPFRAQNQGGGAPPAR